MSHDAWSLPKSKRQILSGERKPGKLIEIMHARHGADEQGRTCRQCAYLISHTQSRTWWKCSQYNPSHSQATDWRLTWPACGLFIRTQPVVIEEPT